MNVMTPYMISLGKLKKREPYAVATGVTVVFPYCRRVNAVSHAC
jgi:hypothetical protein